MSRRFGFEFPLCSVSPYGLFYFLTVLIGITLCGCGGGGGGEPDGPPTLSRFSITDLGTLGGSRTTVGAINNKGQVVGDSTLAGDEAKHAFLWQGSGMQDLGTLGSWSSASDINENGQIVGGTDGKLFLWQNGIMTAMDDRAGEASSAGPKINDSGQIVGHNGGIIQADGAKIDVDFNPNGINNSGQVVGSGNGAVLWQNGVETTLPGFNGYAEAINANGVAIGSIDSSQGKWQVVKWENGVVTPLPRINDANHWPNSINTFGQVVGFMQVAEYVNGNPYRAQFRALLWHNGTVVDLNTLIPANSGWTLNTAVDINDKGQIVGDGIHNGRERGFLLNPQ